MSPLITRTRVALLAVLVPVLAIGGLAPSPARVATRPTLVFNGENNRLNIYDASTGAKQTLIASAADAPGVGLDINAEICIVPDTVKWKPRNEIWFIAGEDTEQHAQAGVIKQGWGLFKLRGDRIGRFSAVEVGKLVPDSFVTASDNPENYGCAVLPDGRILTTDVGDQLPTSPATGQLIEWFPNPKLFKGPIGPDRNDFAKVPHCKIDVRLGTAGGMAVDGTTVYVASNRPDVDGAQVGGVYRYDSTVWPTGPSAAQGCSRADATGKPLAAADRVGKSLFIPQSPLLLTPSDIVASGRGTWFVSSVFTGQVAEFDRTGLFTRYVLQPPGPLPIGQVLGVTPFGIGVTPDGTLWIADIGVQGDGPAAGQGSVVRVRFGAGGAPLAPETVDDALEFPDGIGVLAGR